MRDGKSELRCFCSRQPLLAMYGVGPDGRAYLHIRVYKQHRVFGEMVCRGGQVDLMCRECVRWHRITIRDRVPLVAETVKPIELDASFSEAS